MSVDYIARLKAEKRKYFPLDRGDKSDKRGFGTFGTPPIEEKNSLFPNSGRDSEPRTEKSWRWRVDFIDHESLTVSFTPAVSHAEALEQYPNAVAAEPVPDSTTGAVDPVQMTPEDEATIRAWLDHIGETDLAAIAEVLDKCLHDPDARTYYLAQANPEPFDREAFEERAGIVEFDGGLPREDAEAVAWSEDDRRRCAHCLNLLQNGVCRVAGPGERIKARRGYQPNQSWLHRCPEYRPCPDDPDRRTGRERWPEFRT
jgi:hypothetical protein